MFTFASDVLLGRIAAFYGLSIPAAARETSLGDFVRAGLRGGPTLGDRIRLEQVQLVVRGVHGGRITRIGLELEAGRCASPA